MNAIYFPFTYISEQTAKTIAAVFQPLTVYLPTAGIVPPAMKTLSAEGILDIRTPIEKDEEKLLAANKDYIDWGYMHKKSVVSSLKHRSATPYLFDDSWTVQIKTDIQKKFKKETVSESDHDFTARLFLLITQDHDKHHHEMTQDVQSIEKMEESLFKNLRADEFQAIPEESEPLSTGLQDTGVYMTKERLSSWYTLMKHDHTPPSHFFITSSPGVWEYLLDASTDVPMVTEDLSNLLKESTISEQDQNNLAEIIHFFQTKKWSPSNHRILTTNNTTTDGTNVNVNILIIPDTWPEDFFSGFAQKTPEKMIRKQTRFRNTVIGIIQ
jgi:hypothetical protein